jgi:transposase
VVNDSGAFKGQLGTPETGVKLPGRIYPPWGYSCLYKDCCPHMDELSTAWVYGSYRRSEDVYQEQLRIFDNYQATINELYGRIALLEKENAELKARNKTLHQKQFKANKIKAETCKTSNRRGAPSGHKGWTRPVPEHIDRTVDVPAPDVCPRCGRKGLSPVAQTMEHIQEDIIIVKRPVVTKYVHAQSYCPGCNTEVANQATDEILNAPIGPSAKSVAIYLRYRIGVSYRKTQSILNDLFGLYCVPASLVGFDKKASKNGTPLYDDLREKIRVSDVVHADETSWRNDGLSHFVWYAGNDYLAYFHIDRHRSSVVAKGIFGEDFKGVIVRDRYAAYNDIGEYQSCLAHIITKAGELKKEYDLSDFPKDKNVLRFLDDVAKLFSQACGIGQALKSGGISRDSAAGIEKDLVSRLNKICRRSISFKPAETLRLYLSGSEQKHLFTFLRRPGVPPTNNQAEQSLRNMVIFRKICFGTRSASGIKNHSIIPSLIHTASRQGVDPRLFINTLLTANTKTAHAALYNNSS